jgi:hypothetical protein
MAEFSTSERMEKVVKSGYDNLMPKHADEVAGNC